MESKFKFKLKQILILLICVAIAVTLNILLDFTPLVDSLVLVFFILLGCWFTYQNYKRREIENKHSDVK